MPSDKKNINKISLKNIDGKLLDFYFLIFI